jgi:hypothetical protein
MKHPIVVTPKGEQVYVDLVASSAAISISRNPHLLTLVGTVLRQIQPQGDYVRMEQDMGKSVGYAAVVPTAGNDMVFYAKPMYDQLFMRFVKNNQPPQTRYVSIILQRDTQGAYELRDTWIGKQHPPRPGSTNETPASLTYWQGHAYAYNGQVIQPRTVTKVCPY